MKKVVLILLVLLAAVGLTACGSKDKTTASAATSDAARPESALPEAVTILAGTFELEDTANAVTAEQAAKLLPLWKAYRSLSSSTTVAAQELEAVQKQIVAAMSDEQLAAIAALEITPQSLDTLAEGLGLEMTTMATVKYWDLSLSDPKTSARNKAIAYTKEYLQIAKWLGLKVVLVIPGAVDVFFKPDFKAVPYAQVWKLATDSIRRLLPTAQKLGVTMAVENVWNYFLTDPMAMRAFVDQFKSPRLGVYFDVGNCVVNGFPEHWIEILGRRIKAVHVKSFQRCGGAGTAEGFTDDLKKADINWRSVIAGLRKIKYTGPLTAEMPPSMAVARNTAKTMKAIFG